VGEASVLKIVGYGDRFSVAPGEIIRFMVSATANRRYRAELVRIIHGDCNPQGPGFKAEQIASPFDGGYGGQQQEVHAGSYVRAPHHECCEGLGSFTLAAMIWPTTPAKGVQGIVCKWDEARGAGIRLEVGHDGGLTVTVADGRGGRAVIGTGTRMLERRWYLVAAAYDDAAGLMTLVQRPTDTYAYDDAAEVSSTIDITPAWPDSPLIIAGWALDQERVGGFYNGKIDSPAILSRALSAGELNGSFLRPMPAAVRDSLVLAFDFSREIPSTRAIDAGPFGLHGDVANLPARAMKGWNWTGEEQCWWRKLEHYGAIHFHDDDLYDAGWASDFSFTVPADMKSGIYAAHLVIEGADGEAEDGTGEDYISFFVRSPRGPAGRKGRPKLAFLAPTAAYIAYANHQEHLHAEPAEMVIGRLLVFQPTDLFWHEHVEYGASLYDLHTDGSGVCYSSRLRPILNMRPKYSSWVGGSGSGLWQFNADTHLTDWLEHEGFAFDVITDEDLHDEGFDALAAYRVVVTGTHPEYYSTAMWDAMKAWLDRGGRLVYVGANGWYWRVAYHPTLPGVIEVRRAEDGIRTWEAHPGEYYHSFSGEYGGLWRRLGRPPNVICGIGFTAQGFDVSSYYVRRKDSFDPRAAFIFEGIGPDERIGDFGLVGGGAAGMELDRVEFSLGSPPNTLLLASSEGHTDLVALVNEEFTVVPPNLSGSQHPNVRADLAFFETAAGGAVFSTGSIAWCGSLSHNGYDNNVARIMRNVIHRFLDPAPFAG
jgi:N,N-dimethylformamidase beta subunit-like, C-terminal/Concanavalin A-like lectin/glucanases superfamily